MRINCFDFDFVFVPRARAASFAAYTSVHRGQGNCATSSSTHVSTSPPSEYGGLYDRATDKASHELHGNSQQQQQQQVQQQQEQEQPLLPRPALAAAMSLGGGKLPDGKSRVSDEQDEACMVTRLERSLWVWDVFWFCFVLLNVLV